MSDANGRFFEGSTSLALPIETNWKEVKTTFE